MFKAGDISDNRSEFVSQNFHNMKRYYKWIERNCGIRGIKRPLEAGDC